MKMQFHKKHWLTLPWFCWWNWRKSSCGGMLNRFYYDYWLHPFRLKYDENWCQARNTIKCRTKVVIKIQEKFSNSAVENEKICSWKTKQEMWWKFHWKIIKKKLVQWLFKIHSFITIWIVLNSITSMTYILLRE